MKSFDIDWSTGGISFSPNDGAIHEIAVTKLVNGSAEQLLLEQGKYAYLVSGGSAGILSYRRTRNSPWVKVASWHFYGAYLLVRYRATKWLSPLFQELFALMNFQDADLSQGTFILKDAEGRKIQGRKLRLEPPNAIQAILRERFGHPEPQY